MQAHSETRDELTGLPDRRSVDQLSRALALDAKSDLVAVLIELPPLADGMRKTIAQRLRACARGDDMLARVDDNRFALLLTPRLGADDEDRLLARLRVATGAPVLGFNVAFGIARCPEDGMDVDALLASAAARLYEAVVAN